MANAYISTDPDISDFTPVSKEGEILKELKKDKDQRTLGAYATKQPITLTVPYEKKLQIGIPYTGGSVTPGTPDQFTGGSFPAIDPTQKKVTAVNTIYYFYDLAGYYLTNIGVSYTPSGDFSVPVYLTIAIADFNWFRTGVGTKYEPLNSFKIADLSFQLSDYSFYLYDNERLTDVIRQRVDWTVPLDDRPVVDFTSGIKLRDFENYDPTKITKFQKEQLLDGTLKSPVFVYCVDTSSLSTNDQNFMALDVAPYFTFYGSLDFYYLGVGASYTPVV